MSLRHWLVWFPACFATACTAQDLASPATSKHDGKAETAGGGAPRVVADVDMDYDDAAALAYLCQQHKLGTIELSAVTVVNDGAGYPGKALKHARCLLERCGLTDIPVADGVPAPDAPNQFPPAIRDGVALVLNDVFKDCAASELPAEITAVDLMRQVISGAQSVHIMTFGPLTNLADLLSQPEGARGIAAVSTMAGAVDVGGNLCCGVPGGFDNTQEFNVWIDPAAAATVLGTLPEGLWTVVPLDATNGVPITQTYVDELVRKKATPEAEMVAAIAKHPTVYDVLPQGFLYWWDPLNAVAALHGTKVADFEGRKLRIVTSGPQAGRTEPTEEGRIVWLATQAHAQAFAEIFLAELNGERAIVP